MNKIKYFNKEISYIKDDNKKKDIEYLINLLPDYFFSIPLSDTDVEYPKYVLANNGLLKYTKVCVRIAIDLFDTVNNLSDNDKDLIIMALIMCNGLIKGINEEENVRDDHPLLMSKLIMENASGLKMDIDDVRKLCMMIESHMGKDNECSNIELPVPRSEIQRFVYRCCYLASRKYLNVRFSKLDIV